MPHQAPFTRQRRIARPVRSPQQRGVAGEVVGPARRGVPLDALHVVHVDLGPIVLEAGVHHVAGGTVESSRGRVGRTGPDLDPQPAQRRVRIQRIPGIIEPPGDVPAARDIIAPHEGEQVNPPRMDRATEHCQAPERLPVALLVNPEGGQLSLDRSAVLKANTELPEVVDAFRPPGRLAGILHRGENQRRQDGDDRDHHQQFNQGEPCPDHSLLSPASHPTHHSQLSSSIHLVPPPECRCQFPHRATRPTLTVRGCTPDRPGPATFQPATRQAV